MNTPVEQLEVVIADTSALSVRDEARTELVAKLKGIAERVPGMVAFAESLVINNKRDADVAASERNIMIQNTTEAETSLREFDDKLIERLFRNHRAWCALINTFTDPLNSAARTVKAKLISWQQLEADKAAKEQRRLQEIADANARAERDRLTKAAEKLKTPELKEQRLEAAAQIVATQVFVAAPKVAVKMQRRWVVVGIDRAKFLEAAAKDKNLQGFVEINQNMLTRSKSANAMLEIPGVSFTQIIV